MSIRGRLNQLQTKANWTMDDARAAIQEAMEFLARLEQKLDDGIGVNVVIPPRKKFKEEMHALWDGLGCEIPATMVIDLLYSRNPHRISEFVGGPFNGKNFRITDEQQQKRSITLKGNHLYCWDGYKYQYEGVPTEVEGIKPAD